MNLSIFLIHLRIYNLGDRNSSLITKMSYNDTSIVSVQNHLEFMQKINRVVQWTEPFSQ